MNMDTTDTDFEFEEYSDFQTKTLATSTSTSTIHQPQTTMIEDPSSCVSFSNKKAHELLSSQVQIQEHLCYLLKYMSDNNSWNQSPADLEKTRKILYGFNITRDQLLKTPLIPNASALDLAASSTQHTLSALNELTKKITLVENEHRKELERKSQRGIVSKFLWPNS